MSVRKKSGYVFVFLFSLYAFGRSPKLFCETAYADFGLKGRYETAIINAESFTTHNHVYKSLPEIRYKEKALHDKSVFTSPLTVFYPAAEGSFPLVIIGHGWGDSKKSNASLARCLASYGYTAVIFSAKKRHYPEDFLAAFKRAHELILSAAENPQNRLFGKIDTAKTAVIGHSMGGTAALYYAVSCRKVCTVAALHPYNGASPFIELIGGQNKTLGSDLHNLGIPVLILTGEKDKIAYPEKTFEFCKNCNPLVPLAFFSIKGGKHVHPMDKIGNMVSGSFNAEKHRLYRLLVLSWLDLFLKENGDTAALYLNSECFTKIKDCFYSSNEAYPPYLFRNLPAVSAQSEMVPSP